MFDDLRQSSVAPQADDEDTVREPLIERMPIFRQLTPQQRFIIALLLFVNVTILGFGCLLATGAMMP
jgi:hypothetical protein